MIYYHTLFITGNHVNENEKSKFKLNNKSEDEDSENNMNESKKKKAKLVDNNNNNNNENNIEMSDDGLVSFYEGERAKGNHKIRMDVKQRYDEIIERRRVQEGEMKFDIVFYISFVFCINLILL